MVILHKSADRVVLASCGCKLLVLDPKPSDLTMNKLKEFEDSSGRLHSSLWQ